MTLLDNMGERTGKKLIRDVFFFFVLRRELHREYKSTPLFLTLVPLIADEAFTEATYVRIEGSTACVFPAIF